MKLDLKALISKLVNAPLVIEQGTSGIWTYRKWSDGTSECWGIFQATCAINTSSSAFFGYRSNAVTTSFPTSLFVATPVVNAVNADSGGAIVDNTNGTSSTTFSVWFASGTSRSSSTRPVNVYAIGKWK